MKIICAWCKKEMGEKEPLSDTSITHTICKPCSKEFLGVDIDKETQMKNPKLSIKDIGEIWDKLSRKDKISILKDLKFSKDHINTITTSHTFFKHLPDWVHIKISNYFHKIASSKKENPKKNQYRVWYTDNVGDRVFSRKPTKSEIVSATSYKDASSKLYDKYGNKIHIVEVEKYYNRNPGVKYHRYHLDMHRDATNRAESLREKDFHQGAIYAHNNSLLESNKLGINPKKLETEKFEDKELYRVVILQDTSTGEYRVPGPQGTEAQAYYTDDKQDAIGTAEYMWKSISKSDPIIIRFRSVSNFDKFLNKNPGAKWHRDRVDEAVEMEKIVSTPELKASYGGEIIAHARSANESRRLGINPIEDLDKAIADFVKQYGVASGGNWAVMLMSAIKNAAYQEGGKWQKLYNSMDPDRSYQFDDLYLLIAKTLDPEHIEIKENPKHRYEDIEYTAVELAMQGHDISDISYLLQQEFRIEDTLAKYYAKRAMQIISGKIDRVTSKIAKLLR